MATYGSIGEFDPEKEEWTPYVERLGEYFIANDVEDATKKRAILLSSCGHSTYQTARRLFAPTKLNTQTYGKVVESLTAHFSPKPKDMVQRCKFNARVRQPGESISTFCAELRSLAEHCNFEDAALENMLRDRLVCGIADRAMQQRLLSEPNLTFKKAYDLAVLMESVRKDTTQLQSKQGAEVHFVQKSTPRGPPPKLNPCYRCGGRHKSSVCKFKEENCHFCGKKGHISRVCRSRQRQQHPAKSRPSGANPEHDAKHVDVKGADASTVPSGSTEQPTDSSVVEDPVYWTFQLSKQGTDPLLVTLSADQADLQMEIDTGASVSVISEDTYLSVWPGDQRPVLQKSTAQLRTYSGELMHVCGTITVCVFYRQQQKTLPLLVVRGAGRPLFGRDWMKEIKLETYTLSNCLISELTIELWDWSPKYTAVVSSHCDVLDHVLSRLCRYLEEERCC